MENDHLKPIGTIHVEGTEMFIELDERYRQGLAGLDGFSHINVLWWFSEFDNQEARGVLSSPQPYKQAPEVMGVFATRSPLRPNPLALTAVSVLDLDNQTGIIKIAYIDANDGTPVLDIKPYTPSLDRVENPQVPSWCDHWPKSVETSGAFNWAEEFNF
ncbi:MULTISPECIES: tRNA (N6-threonylcarbamoyladenosine(37)-N6)-methyltransferase TrmO [Acetobacterium]|jgi:tRNA-Thr(GGU) m(6)t(6)A37 methyltransferase TsaA|uniref:tRNA (N6-threonylcarbamoyladenosine(37)-N6)-methyltransferase TrmO n=1 Tax=Acetobacterium TaxID=33951 RepID=UPI002ACA1667|nr:tRNA (N6-threonylcarbamoyladenosine(37)-N6)-methyltransferase TrmO [Acetobacterium sp. K1/6]MDZ5724281.1 tRNA (N6-threonylcarbamoyladenosine(37)-N6)-methyltransferase TrmO [Acetobacterium sp. K1/6]